MPSHRGCILRIPAPVPAGRSARRGVMVHATAPAEAVSSVHKRPRGRCGRMQSAPVDCSCTLLCVGRGHIICPGSPAGGSTASVRAAGSNGCAGGCAGCCGGGAAAAKIAVRACGGAVAADSSDNTPACSTLGGNCCCGGGGNDDPSSGSSCC